MGRATFYLHFRSKEDLLRASPEELRQILARDWNSGSSRELPVFSSIGFSLAFFQHVVAVADFAIVGREDGVIVDRQMRLILAGLVREDMGSPADPVGMEVPATWLRNT